MGICFACPLLFEGYVEAIAAMKILVVSNAYKNFASSREIGELIRAGIHQVHPTWVVDIVPIADGGAGTVESLVIASQGEYRVATAFNPAHMPIDVCIGYSPVQHTAFLDITDTAGAGKFFTDDWNTIHLSSFGVGVAIRAAAQLGVDRIVIGLGGSIISDGGLGMAQALGVRFYSLDDLPVHPHNGKCMTCQDLAQVHRIDMSDVPELITSIHYTVLSDVDIRLLGPNGQAYTFARQKRANETEIGFIESALANWNRALGRTFNDDFDVPLAGAAGGLGAGLKAILKGELKQGIDFVLDNLSFDARCKDYDLVVTGEGHLDRTTRLKKACYGIAKRCQALNKPCFGVFGRIEEIIDEFLDCSIDASIVSLSSGESPRLFSKRAIVDAASMMCRQIGE